MSESWSTSPTKFAQFAALAFLIHEICITLDDEVNFIWSKPNGAWIKWLFLFTRYFTLAAQITNRVTDDLITSNTSITEPTLMNWVVCQTAVGAIVLLAVEIVLMARVYALYNKNTWVGCGFVVLILGKAIAIVAAFVINLREEHFKLFPIASSSYLLFAIGGVMCQVTILSLTLIKYWTAIQEGWGSLPIVALVVRDGIVTFFILIIVSTLTVIANVTHYDCAPIGNAWLSPIAACAGCRLIINMQHVSRRPERRTTVELTTL